jgi:hypothetical protein
MTCYSIPVLYSLPKTVSRDNNKVKSASAGPKQAALLFGDLYSLTLPKLYSLIFPTRRYDLSIPLHAKQFPCLFIFRLSRQVEERLFRTPDIPNLGSRVVRDTR